MFIFMVVFAVFISSLLLLIKLGSKYNKYEKYEFENRTDGGVVKFTSFEDAGKHNAKKKTLEALSGLIVGICFLSGIVLIVMVLTFSSWA